MNKDIYVEAIANTDCAFAYHRVVYDQEDNMIDYVFLDVNKSFEKMTGLKKEKILNRRFVEDIAEDKEHAKNWVKEYERIVSKGKKVEFEDYSEEFNKHFSIKAYAVDKDHFVTIFTNKTVERKIQEITKYFSDNMGENIDYKKIAHLAQEITGAEIAAFNLFDKKGQDFKTVAVFADSETINKGLEIFGRNIENKKWEHDPVRERLTANNTITYFKSLDQLTHNVISREIIEKLTEVLDLGMAAVAKIEKDGRVLGDFTLIFAKNDQLQNKELFKLYLSQLGLFIEKTSILRKLKENQKMFYTLAQFAPVGFITCDREGKIHYVNRKLLEIMESPSYEATKEINLLTFANLVRGGFSEKLKEAMEKDREVVHEMPYKSLWGKYSWLNISFTPNKEDGEVIGANILVTDITEKKRTVGELKQKAERDPLTRAYNRHALDTLIPEKLDKAKDNDLISSIVLLDVDDFKDINDNYGHRAGDKVLQYLAMRIKQELRGEDLIIRAGGDEFLLYLHDIKDESNATEFVDRIFKKITGSYRLDNDSEGKDQNVDVHCSIGVAFYPKDGKDIYELMSKADRSLYTVKRNGKSDYHIEI